MFIFRATVSAVSCLVVPAFICIHLLCSYYSKSNDDDDDDDDDKLPFLFYSILKRGFICLLNNHVVFAIQESMLIVISEV